MWTLGKQFFGDLKEISSCSGRELLSFVNAAGYSDNLSRLAAALLLFQYQSVLEKVGGIKSAHHRANWAHRSGH